MKNTKEQFGSKTAYLIDRYNALIGVAGHWLGNSYRNKILRLRTEIIGGSEFAELYRDAYRDCQTSGLGWMHEWHPNKVLNSKVLLSDAVLVASEIDRTMEPSTKIVNGRHYKTNVIEEDVYDNPYLLLG